MTWVTVITISRVDLDRPMINQSESKTPVSALEESESEGSSAVILEQTDSEIVVEIHTPEAKPESKETTSSNPVMPVVDADAQPDILDITDPMDAGTANAAEALPLAGPSVPDASSSQSLSEPTVQRLQLENAMAGRSYATIVDLAKLPFNVSGIDDVIQTEFSALGLTLSLGTDDKPSLRIEGILLPDTQGDHTFSWDINTSSRLQLDLLVNADPKSLWKNLEPASDLPYAKPHTATAYLEGEGYKIIAASRRGRSHAHEGTFRDDDFSVTITDFGWDILIVADGAGSAKCSREGSRLACSTATMFLQEKIPQLLGDNFLALLDGRSDGGDRHRSEIQQALYQVLCGAAFAAYKKIEEEAKTTDRDLKEYSTTFLCSIVRRMKKGILVASFGIGDGAIGVYNGETNEVELMNSPDGGDFSGQTRFLTMTELIGDGAEMMRRIKYRVFDSFTAMFLMTDGISDPKFGTDNSLLSPEKWQALGEDLLTHVDFSAKNKKAADELCEWTDFWAQGEHDDRTLAIMY